jgi:hypothetical protein
MDPDLFFERQHWRQWLARRQRSVNEVLSEMIARARLCERLDQSFFSAALFEALWGRAPQVGQQPVPPMHKKGVPAWVLPVLLRGLSDDAQLRFPNTRALLDALDPLSPGTQAQRLFVSA